MTLENLLKTGQLKPHDPDAAEIRRLLEAARRNLKDSAATNISPENRFDAAYKAIMQSALVAPMANGFIPDTKQTGAPCDNASVAAQDDRHRRRPHRSARRAA